MKLKLSQIKPDPLQPRKKFSNVEELAHNMKLEGLIHPIEVDADYIIIVGERRYRAAKMLGWDEIDVVVNEDKLTPYERLRRQMSENLFQSAASNGDSMNPLDTAHGWATLYELKTGKPYEPGTQGVSHDQVTGRILPGPFKQIADEIGADKHTVWELIKLLDESELVQNAVQSGIPRTYIREANNAPENVRQEIKDKIVAGDYKTRDEVIQDVNLAKQIPDLAKLSIERQRNKESLGANLILNSVIKLGLALEQNPINDINPTEQGIIKAQLSWIHGEITNYLQYGENTN